MIIPLKKNIICDINVDAPKTIGFSCMKSLFARFYLTVFLFALTCLSAYGQSSSNNCPAPNFVFEQQQSKLVIANREVVFVTHSSTHFDPLSLTKNPVNQLVEKTMDSMSIFYLHDSRSNINLFNMYLYDYCEPTAYLHSDIGFHKLDLSSVDSIMVAGGYFEMCENNTIVSSIDSWATQPNDSSTKKYKVTQITDAIFAVGQDIRSSDPYYLDFRDIFYNDLRRRHHSSAIPLSTILGVIESPESKLEYLSRRLPKNIPSNWNIFLQLQGEELRHRFVGEGSPTIIFEYVSSDELNMNQ